MVSQFETSYAPDWGETASGEVSGEKEHKAFAVFWQRVGKRRDSLLLIQQVNRLINTVQLHRGMSMSLLAGSDYFSQDIDRLEMRLRRQMIALEVFSEQSGELLSASYKSSLHRSWLTITRDWRDDVVIDNFELHSHFIEELLAIVAILAENLSEALFDSSASTGDVTVTYPQAFKQLELLNFVARQLPQVTELIAKARGLSCHAATLGRVDETLARNLRFLIQNLKAENEKLRHQTERLATVAKGEYRSIADIKNFEIKLMYFFACVEDDLLSGAGSRIAGHRLFKLASEIIDIYSRVGEEGWRLVRHYQEKDWQDWIQHP